MTFFLLEQASLKDDLINKTIPDQLANFENLLRGSESGFFTEKVFFFYVLWAVCDCGDGLDVWTALSLSQQHQQQHSLWWIQLSVADLVLFEVLEIVVAFSPGALDGLEAVSRLHKQVASLPRVAAYLASGRRYVNPGCCDIPVLFLDIHSS